MNRETLFSIHTHSDGHIALYLEEQDAVKDLVQDVVGSYPLDDLDLLRGAADRSIKADDYFEALDSARDNLGENAPLLCNMTEQEALVLAEDLIRAVKFARISREAGTNYPSLKVVK
jgi:glyoxylase-like metal-dependent hydrolase (beta-lactamase superfamily II)